jgi:hypothetical protein
LDLFCPPTINWSSFIVCICSVSWTPSFLLKRYVLTGIRDGPHEPFIADSVDFVVSQVLCLAIISCLLIACHCCLFFARSYLLWDNKEFTYDKPMYMINLYVFLFVLNKLINLLDSVTWLIQVETLSREDLASRMSLTTDDASVGPLLLSDSFITIMDVCHLSIALLISLSCRSLPYENNYFLNDTISILVILFLHCLIAFVGLVEALCSVITHSNWYIAYKHLFIARDFLIKMSSVVIMYDCFVVNHK